MMAMEDAALWGILAIGGLHVLAGAAFFITALYHFARANAEVEEEKMTTARLVRGFILPPLVPKFTKNGDRHLGKFLIFLGFTLAVGVSFIIFLWSLGVFSGFVHF